MKNGLRLSAFCCVLSFLLPLSVFGQVGAKKPSDPRVETLLKQAGLKYTIDKGGDFRLTYDVGEDRTQLVFILSKTQQLGTLEIRQVWSVAYSSESSFSSEIANLLLEKNSTVKLGSWQKIKMGDKYVAIFSAQVAAETDAAALKQVLEAVTATADDVEEDLTGGKDAF
jgi:hypothetical protein